MQCLKCGTTVQVGDRFCEECGTSLIAKSTGCEKCGAPTEAIDTDGFCSHCGFRQDNRQNERLEIILSPNLAGVSDRGFRHHRNEDYVACARVAHRNAYVLVVCDGVSSSESPELAAKAAAESACRALAAAVEMPNIVSHDTMNTAITEAMSSVCAIPYTRITGVDPPSTTIVAALVVERTATIGWLGDSRAYWISPNGSRQLTRDDSWLQEAVSSGEMSEAEAIKSPQAHAITRWLGVDAINVEPSIVNFHLPGFGYLLLCTDGLWNYTTNHTQIDTLVKSDADPATIARSLVEFALQSGGHDNITVAVLSF